MIKMTEKDAKQILQDYTDYINGKIDEFPYSFVAFRAAKDFIEAFNGKDSEDVGNSNFNFYGIRGWEEGSPYIAFFRCHKESAAFVLNSPNSVLIAEKVFVPEHLIKNENTQR